MPDESDSKPERQKTAPKAAAGDMMSPRDHALATGNGPKKRINAWTGPGFSRPMGSVEHEVAKTLHGWDEHEHETGSPIQLSRADYLAALAATHPEDKVVDGKVVELAGNPKPHPAALSPYKGKRGQIALGQKPTTSKAAS